MVTVQDSKSQEEINDTDTSKVEMNYESQRYPPDMTERSVILSDPGNEKQPNIQIDIQAASRRSQSTPPDSITKYFQGTKRNFKALQQTRWLTI